MLADVSIYKYMRSGDIVIRPFSDLQMRPAGVTLVLDNTFLIPKPGGVADLLTGERPEYEKKVIEETETFVIEPGEFVIAQTLERVGISEKIGMMVDGRSTLGRIGLLVHATSAVFDTGEEPKFVTLQLKNLSNSKIILAPKVSIARAVFFLLNPPSKGRYDRYGRYKSTDEGYPVL